MRKILYFITLIALCILTVGLFIGKVYRYGDAKAQTVWGPTVNLYRIVDSPDQSFFKSVGDVAESYSKEIDRLLDRDRELEAMTVVLFLAGEFLSVLAALIVLIFSVSGIVSIAKKQEANAWGKLLVAWIFVFIAKLTAFAGVAFLKANNKNAIRNYMPHFDIALLISLGLIVAFMILTAVCKSRAKRQTRLAAPVYPYPAGGQYPMQ